MSATQQVPKEEQLKQYLLDKSADGDFYFKSKFIADDVGLSPKQIGALMSRIRNSATELEIERWSYTGATTWHIAPAKRIEVPQSEQSASVPM